MRNSSNLRAILLLFAVALLSFIASQNVCAAGATIIRGWLSDESCARGRASGGVFTGTNPECAKKCIASGAKMVLIVPDQKTILTIDNPATAQTNIGNYVEITGSVKAKTKTLHIDTLKMLTKGVAMCGLPAKKSRS
jgi:hypothetical protein